MYTAILGDIAVPRSSNRRKTLEGKREKGNTGRETLGRKTMEGKH